MQNKKLTENGRDASGNFLHELDSPLVYKQQIQSFSF